MDPALNFKTTHRDGQDFYKKMLELQETLRKSEEQRMRLEERFNLLARESRGRHEVSINNLRMRYIEFLEEQRARDQRNHQLRGVLDKLDASLARMTAKTDRLGVLRKQYQAYLLRAYANKGGGTGDSGIGSQKDETARLIVLGSCERCRSNVHITAQPAHHPQGDSSSLQQIPASMQHGSTLSQSLCASPLISQDRCQSDRPIAPHVLQEGIQPNRSSISQEQDRLNRNLPSRFPAETQFTTQAKIVQSNLLPIHGLYQPYPQNDTQLYDGPAFIRNGTQPCICSKSYDATSGFGRALGTVTFPHTQGASTGENIFNPYGRSTPFPSHLNHSTRYSRDSSINDLVAPVPLTSTDLENLMRRHEFVLPGDYLHNPNSLRNVVERTPESTLVKDNELKIPAPEVDTTEALENELDRHIKKIRNMHRHLDLQSLDDPDIEENTSGDLLNVTLSDDGPDQLPVERAKDNSVIGTLPRDVKEVLGLADELASVPANVHMADKMLSNLSKRDRTDRSHPSNVSVSRQTVGDVPRTVSEAISQESPMPDVQETTKLPVSETCNDVLLANASNDVRQNQNISARITDDKVKSKTAPSIAKIDELHPSFNSVAKLLENNVFGRNELGPDKQGVTQESPDLQKYFEAPYGQSSLPGTNGRITEEDGTKESAVRIIGEVERIEEQAVAGVIKELEPPNSQCFVRNTQGMHLNDKDRHRNTTNETPIRDAKGENNATEIQQKIVDSLAEDTKQEMRFNDEQDNLCDIGISGKAAQDGRDSDQTFDANREDGHIDKFNRNAEGFENERGGGEDEYDSMGQERDRFSIERYQHDSNRDYDPDQEYERNHEQSEQFVAYEPNELYQHRYGPAEHVDDPTGLYKQDPNQPYEYDPNQRYEQDPNEQYDEHFSNQQYGGDTNEQYAVHDPNEQYDEHFSKQQLGGDTNEQYAVHDPNEQYDEHFSNQQQHDPNEQYDEHFSNQQQHDPNEQYDEHFSKQQHGDDANEQYAVHDPNEQYDEHFSNQQQHDPNEQYDEHFSKQQHGGDNNEQYAVHDPNEQYDEHFSNQQQHDPNEQYDEHFSKQQHGGDNNEQYAVHDPNEQYDEHCSKQQYGDDANEQYAVHDPNQPYEQDTKQQYEHEIYDYDPNQQLFEQEPAIQRISNEQESNETHADTNEVNLRDEKHYDEGDQSRKYHHDPEGESINHEAAEQSISAPHYAKVETDEVDDGATGRETEQEPASVGIDEEVTNANEYQTNQFPEEAKKKMEKDVIAALLESDTESIVEHGESTGSDFNFN